MNAPWEWTERNIQALINENRPEDVSLEYKRLTALEKTEKNKNEISKDVSAMANSAGGVLIYGIDENKLSSSIRLDVLPSPVINTEWVEQVIDSNIKRRISGVRVQRIQMQTNVVYVVWVPQSSQAPHMASDHRYYKRLGTVTAPMEEYEVRDVGRRSESPDLDYTFAVTSNSSSITLIPSITNSSVEPAFYATLKLYLDPSLSTSPHDRGFQTEWAKAANHARVIWNTETTSSPFEVYSLYWGVPERRPLLEDDPSEVGGFTLVTSDPHFNVWRVGCEIRSPKMPTKMYGIVIDMHSGSKIQDGRVQFRLIS